LDPFGKNSYNTAGFSKTKKGKVTAKPTMLSPRNIRNLEAVELPEVDEHSEYDITEPYDDINKLKAHLDSIIKTGRIVAYKLNSDVNNNTTISYRGNKRELLNYNNKKEFKKRDIYCAIRREAKDDTHAVCRIMPVIYNEKMNWVGIYLICALDQTVN